MMKSQEGNNPIISPNSLYRPGDLEGLLGKRCVRSLRENGLCAVGGWYLGEKVLESFRHACDIKYCQRVPERKEEQIEKERAKKVEENIDHRKIQPVSKQQGSDSLRSQLEEVKRLRQKAV